LYYSFLKVKECKRFLGSPQCVCIAVGDLESGGKVPLWLQCVLDRIGALLLLPELEDSVGVGLADHVGLDQVPGLHQLHSQLTLESF